MKGEWWKCSLSNLQGKNEWCGRAARKLVAFDSDQRDLRGVCLAHFKQLLRAKQITGAIRDIPVGELNYDPVAAQQERSALIQRKRAEDAATLTRQQIIDLLGFDPEAETPPPASPWTRL